MKWYKMNMTMLLKWWGRDLTGIVGFKKRILFLLVLCLTLQAFAQEKYFDQGLALMDREEFKKAIPFFSRCIRNGFRPHSAFGNRALCYYQGDKLRQASRDLQAALQIDSSDYIMNDLMGVVLDESGDPQGAVSYLTRAVTLNPVYDTAWYNLYLIYRYVYADTTRALDCINRAVTACSGNFEYCVERSGLYVEMEKYELAEEDMKRALQLSPDFHYPWLLWGWIKEATGDYDSARVLYERAVELAPENLQPRFYRASFFLNRGNPEEALEDILLLNKKENNNPDYRELYGRYLMMAANYPEAIRLFSQILNKDRTNTDVLGYRAYSYGESGDFIRSMADLLRLSELDPLDEWAWQYRGSLVLDQGNYEEAILYFTKATEINPANGENYFNRGFARYDLGDLEGACYDWNLALGHGVKEAREMIAEECFYGFE